MNEVLLIAVIAALYALGTVQGGTITASIEEELAGTNEELSPKGRFMLTWGWPLATVMYLVEKSKDGE